MPGHLSFWDTEKTGCKKQTLGLARSSLTNFQREDQVEHYSRLFPQSNLSNTDTFRKFCGLSFSHLDRMVYTVGNFGGGIFLSIFLDRPDDLSLAYILLSVLKVK